MTPNGNTGLGQHWLTKHQAITWTNIGLLSVMLRLHWITTNLGPIYELKNSGFLGLVSSRKTFIVRSQARVYIDFGERLTYE